MDVQSLLAQTSLFAGLDDQALSQLAARTRVIAVPSGHTVIAEGMPADCLYIVAVGRLRVQLLDGTVVNDIGRLEPTGEIALLSNEPRTATVYAVRDSKLLRIAREDLFAVFAQYPAALLEMTRTIITRLRQNQRAAKLASARHARCFAVIPASESVDPSAFAHGFAEALGGSAGWVRRIDSAFVDAQLGSGISRTPICEGGADEERVIDLLQSQEMEHRHLVYVADREATPWSQRCMRQADRILVLADARQEPEIGRMLHELRQSGVRAQIELVVLRPDAAVPGRVLEWRQCSGARAHFFLRPDDPRDIDLIARSLTGRAVGLVLGGGGARGFAHIGLVRALEERGICVDVLGGTSMGAFVAALMASGYGSEEIQRIARETFVSRNLLNDYTFPSYSLIRGRKIRRQLQDVFGERMIEDLQTPFYCVSTNLTRGHAMVHDSGPLAIWVGTSMCIPGIAPPVAYRGELLVDGAVINSLPTDVMQNLERGPIIASDVSTEGGISAPGIEGPDPEGLANWRLTLKRPSLFSILFRTATLTSESGVANRAARADFYLRMPVDGIALFDWKRIDEIVDRGYQSAMKELPDFEAGMLCQLPS
jgi:NTE family protein